MSGRAILDGPDALKLALFGVNERRGLVMTTADGPPDATWEQSTRLAMDAERLGFEAMIPLARWRGYGGEHNLGARVLETFTWAAGLSALTERIQVFATFHVQTVHPVMAAKMVATIDHISDGRFGLNVVAGSQPDEMAMFGAAELDHDDRYAYAAEWLELVKELWTRTGSFDFHGRFFDAPGAFSEPKPVQRPWPVLMSAGISPAGRAFAAEHVDLIFAAIDDPAKVAQVVADIKQLARDRHGKQLRVFGRAHITCADTAEQAAARYHDVIIRHGDQHAARNVLSQLMANSQTIDWESASMRQLSEAVIRGYFAHPLTGTAEQIAESMAQLADAGLDGLAVTFNDYEDGLQRYEHELLPLLARAGLRRPLPLPQPAGVPDP